MKNVTQQLFEYLIAAQNSNLSVDYNLDKYPVYWFLDEVLAYRHNRIEKQQDGRICITLTQPMTHQRPIETSERLSKILQLTQQTTIDNYEPLVALDELESMLRLEKDALMQKLEDKTKEAIIINEWQQFLLGVNQPRIAMSVAINHGSTLSTAIGVLLQDYDQWLKKLYQRKQDEIYASRAKSVYDFMLRMTHVTNRSKRCYLGVGILQLPTEPAIHHPLLSLGVDVFVNQQMGTCELMLDEKGLIVDPILDHVLFCDLEAVERIRPQINELKIGLFDDDLIASVLQKMANHVHPNTQYVVALNEAGSQTDVPQVVHRTVLFVKEEDSSNSVEKLKNMAHYLLQGNPTTDVLESIVNPNHISKNGVNIDGLQKKEMEDFEFILDDSGKAIMSLLADNHGVAVTETEEEAKYATIAALITYSVATNKRVLITGENAAELTAIKHHLPLYMSGLHSEIPADPQEYERVKEQLITYNERRNNFQLASLKLQQLEQEIKALKEEMATTMTSFVQYRALGSKKIKFKDKFYHAYELAQLIAKLGGKETLDGDNIPQEVSFNSEDPYVKKLWELKPYFTQENMALLNYEFIDIYELKGHPTFNRLLDARARYDYVMNLDNQLAIPIGETIDQAFVNFLVGDLQVVMDAIKTMPTASLRMLKTALSHEDNVTIMMDNAKQIERYIRELEFFSGTTEQKEWLISNLNTGLNLSVLDLPDLATYGHRQLVGFYVDKLTELNDVIKVVCGIETFNKDALAIAPHFKGISSDNVEKVDTLYNTAVAHKSKMDLADSFADILAHFGPHYDAYLTLEDAHETGIWLYDALQKGDIDGFIEAAQTIEDLIVKRENFVAFGDFIEEIGAVMPKFTTSMMQDERLEDANEKQFKAAFEQGKLNNLLGQLKTYQAAAIDEKMSEYKGLLLKRQLEQIEINSWKHQLLTEERDVARLAALLMEERPSKRAVIDCMLAVFPVMFMPLEKSRRLRNFNPELFDLVVFTDANRSNVMRISELAHGHKGIVFGNVNHTLVKPLRLRQEDRQKLMNRYGQTLQGFGEEYFETSLFDLMINSAAWDAQIDLEANNTPLQLKHLGETVKSGAKKCVTTTEEEIFEAMIKMGYQVKCKVPVAGLTVDFLIVSGENYLALNVVGDRSLDEAAVVAQIEGELDLRSKGLPLYIIEATQFYLNRRETLADLCQHLESLQIYPNGG